jgi:hypothetical protein
MFIAYENPLTNASVIVIWDDGELALAFPQKTLGPCEPHNLKEWMWRGIGRTMRVRLGLLREYLREAVLHEMVPMSGMTSPSAPGDDDATVPGHLPNELPPSATLSDEEINGGGLDEGEVELHNETDDRTVGDAAGEGGIDEPDTNPEGRMAPHLRTDDTTSLGSPPEERPNASFYESTWLNREIKRFMLQENPSGAGMVDPTKPPMGAYSDFDMAKDHGDVAKMQGAWYRSPGQEPGGAGDPFRGHDANAQLGFHPPAGDKNPDAAPPETMGMAGIAARRAPPEWTLNAGSDTSKVLGAGAKPTDGEGGGTDSEEGEAAADAEGTGDDDKAPKDDDEADKD